MIHPKNRNWFRMGKTVRENTEFVRDFKRNTGISDIFRQKTKSTGLSDFFCEIGKRPYNRSQSTSLPNRKP